VQGRRGWLERCAGGELARRLRASRELGAESLATPHGPSRTARSGPRTRREPPTRSAKGRGAVRRQQRAPFGDRSGAIRPKERGLARRRGPVKVRARSPRRRRANWRVPHHQLLPPLLDPRERPSKGGGLFSSCRGERSRPPRGRKGWSHFAPGSEANFSRISGGSRGSSQTLLAAQPWPRHAACQDPVHVETRKQSRLGDQYREPQNRGWLFGED
jgi:hypothetical protein